MRDGVLEEVEAGEVAVLERLHFVIDVALALAERPKLAVAVVKDAVGGREPQSDGSPPHHQSVVRVVNAAAHD